MLKVLLFVLLIPVLTGIDASFVFLDANGGNIFLFLFSLVIFAIIFMNFLRENQKEVKSMIFSLVFFVFGIGVSLIFNYVVELKSVVNLM